MNIKTVLPITSMLLIASIAVNLYLYNQLRFQSERLSRYAGHKHETDILKSRSHIDDFEMANAYYYKQIKPILPYHGNSFIVKDSAGIRVITEYDISMMGNLRRTISAQQGDAPEPAMNADPASRPPSAPAR